MSTQPQIIQHRITQLRAAMAQAGVDAVVVPSADPHLSEYLPHAGKAARFFSRVLMVRSARWSLPKTLPVYGWTGVIGYRPKRNWQIPASS